MRSLRLLFQRRRTHDQAGQLLVLMAVALVAVVAMAGLLLDGGNIWVNQREAQAAADTAALAGAQAATAGSSVCATDNCTAAWDIASDNGFARDLRDCTGATQANQGVEVNRPPATGPHAGDSRFVEVIARRAVYTTVTAVVGAGCWIATGRAVSSIASSAVATCNFCVLGNDGTPETLGLDSNANLRVDGAIIVNKADWYTGTTAVNRCGGHNPCTAASCLPDPWSRPGGNSNIEAMCGESFHLTNSNGGNDLLSARTISVGGGWVARLQDLVKADLLAPGCLYAPSPTDWLPTRANVCIGMPPIADPLNDSANPGNVIAPPDPSALTVPVAGTNGCPAGAKVPTGTLASPQRLGLSGTTPGAPFLTICPGLYYGGFSVNGDGRNVKVTMMPGIYYMVGGGASGGGGFVVTGTASIDGSAGVMIYLTGGTESFTESTLPGTGLVQPCVAPSLCVAPTITGSGNGLSSSDLTITVNTNVTYTLKIQGNPTTTAPTGTVTFYDGTAAISAACTDVPLTLLAGTQYKAACTTSYPLFGTRGITGVYSGDARYAGVGPSLIETINAPVGLTAGTLNVSTTTSPCSMGVPCGEVLLHAPTAGSYAGMLVFQGRASGLGMTIWPAAGAPACSGSWMTDGVPGYGGTAPDPCGALGGLSGTIYAPHLSTGGSDHDAGINFRTSGAANLQIITGTVSMNYPSNTRFTYRPELFANGQVHLVE